MPTLHRDSHFVLERYAAPAFVRLARTAEPLVSTRTLERSLLACRSALGELDSAASGILIDWRLSPLAGASDELEDAAVRAAEAFGAQFVRAAFLLLTAASRCKAWSDVTIPVFSDEEAAITFVSAPS